MVKIKRFDILGNVERYTELHTGIFEDKYPINCPAFFYEVFSEDECVGFISGYMTHPGCFYIQRIGIPAILRGKGHAVEWLRDIEAELKGTMTTLTGDIDNDNVSPIIVALKSGWKIIGCHVDSDGKLTVRVEKELWR